MYPCEKKQAWSIHIYQNTHTLILTPGSKKRVSSVMGTLSGFVSNAVAGLVKVQS